MKKIIYIFSFIALVFNACTKDNTFNEKVPINFVFELTSNSNSITKSNTDIFSEFYTNLENGNFVPESYSLTLTNVDTGVEYKLNGIWKKHSIFNIGTGTYRVTGVSSDNTNRFIQETCSFRFDEIIEINSETSTVTLSAIYDSFLLIFIGNDIVEVNNYSGDEVKSFYSFNCYKYAFVNKSLTINNNSEAYIEIVYIDGVKTKCYTKNIIFEKGKYYAYSCLTNGFVIPKMEEGNIDFEQETVSDVVQVFNDSLYVNMLSPGTLYSLYKTKSTGKQCEDEWGEEVWNNITSIKIVGYIDARDFSTIKWNFRNLKNLDISETSITSYKGIYGTVEGYEYTYNANAIPIGAFFYWMSHDIRNFPSELSDEGMSTLKHIKLPSNINSIERNAFARAYNIKDIEIPESVMSIEMCAFRHCHTIKKMYIPENVQTIGMYALTDMNSLSEIHFKSKTLPYYHKTAFGFYNDGTNTEYFDNIKTERGYVIEGDYLKYNDVTLYVPEGYEDVYTEWNNYFKEIIEE